MIQRLKNGKWRVRYEWGYNAYYKSLEKLSKKHHDKLEKLAKLTRPRKKEEEQVRLEIAYIKKEQQRIEKEYPSHLKLRIRRSWNCRNKWQAETVEDLFKAAYDYEAQGEKVPIWLQKELDGLVDAPYRLDFLEEMSYQLASVSGLNPKVVENFDYDLFLSQADINTSWVDSFDITPSEVKKGAKSICFDSETIPLKGKTYIFTGAFIGIAVCEDYVNCLLKLAEDQKVDGIIVAGPWIKYIFLHKRASTQQVLNSVRKLASKVPVFAIRSNLESADLIPELKELGIKFVTKIEDEHNLFLSHKFSRISNKDQLNRFRDYSVDKNLFVHSTYVAFEPQLRGNNIRYIVGSGSSSYATPTSRIWANAYDGQRINAEKYDCIGGHILRFDVNGHVYPSNFYYNHETKSISVNGKTIPLKGSAETAKMHVFLSDVHCKLANKKAIEAFLDFLKKQKDNIKSICINGDFFDNVLLCHHDEKNIPKQIENKIKHKSFLHEIAHARKILSKIVEALGDNKVKLVFKMGNHEINSIKKILQKPLLHFLDTMLDLDTLLGLTEMGFEVIDGRKPYYVGDIPVFHGHEITRPKAAKIMGRKNISGHTHKGRIDNNGTILPTMQDVTTAEYLSYFEEPWALGWAVSYEYKGIVEKPELMLFSQEKYYDFNQLTKIDKIPKEKRSNELTVTFKLD